MSILNTTIKITWTEKSRNSHISKITAKMLIAAKKKENSVRKSSTKALTMRRLAMAI